MEMVLGSAFVYYTIKARGTWTSKEGKDIGATCHAIRRLPLDIC
jgi:hypothetical protein